ncbi:unnamed protein product [Ectocarpus sp. CCAP 1310/34]|nr:unnamed protein product [Ectocarpus sp. CCAP 1310/34]
MCKNATEKHRLIHTFTYARHLRNQKLCMNLPTTACCRGGASISLVSASRVAQASSMRS